jgi:ribose transport system substrate-binding protein
LPDGTGLRVAVIWGSQGNEYNVLNHDSAVAALEEMGVEVVDFNAGGDRNRQVSMIENAIQLQVDGMLMGDIAPEIIDPVILKAEEADIPTVSAHGGSGAVVNDVTSDNFEAGAVGARMVQKWLGDRAPNVITAYEPGYGPIDQLFAAYEAAVPFTVPEYKELGRVNAHWPNTLPEAKAQMEALLQQNTPEDIGLVFGTYDLEAIGMAQAIEEAGLDIPVIGYNLTKDILEMVQRGSPIVATAGGDPKEEGHLAAINLVRYLRGEQLPKITFVPIRVVDRDNIEEYMAGQQ